MYFYKVGEVCRKILESW